MRKERRLYNNNATEVSTDKYLFLVSYHTTVAYLNKRSKRLHVVTEVKWSRTTNRHLKEWTYFHKSSVEPKPITQKKLDELYRTAE